MCHTMHCVLQICNCMCARWRAPCTKDWLLKWWNLSDVCVYIYIYRVILDVYRVIVVFFCFSKIVIIDASWLDMSLIEGYQWRVFTRHWYALITDATSVTRILRVTESPLHASLITFSGIVSYRMFWGCRKRFLDTNKKTNYIARLKTARRIY